ncbi:MAG: Fur family transcriptional regulator [Patescibacteria group bacterium]
MQIAISLEKLLQSADLKITTPRKKVLDVLNMYREPISADVVIQKTKLDKATVYRVLHAFTGANITREIDLRQGKLLYELADGQHHHHVICTGCNSIQCIAACTFSKLKSKIEKQSGFAEITDHTTEFFGTCKKCI